MVEPEFYKMAPEGISVHAARMKIRETTIKGLEEMNTQIESATEQIMDADVDVIAFLGTSASFLRPSLDYEIADRIEKISNRPAVITTTAVVDALNVLNIKKVSVATPYVNEINEKLKDLLESRGIMVLNLKGLGIVDPKEINRQDSSIAYKIAKESYNPEVDGVFISCTGFRTIDIIQRLEVELKKPVVTSNQATFWAVLKKVKVTEPIEGYGVLLERYI